MKTNIIKDKKLLITGSEGFFGKYLCRAAEALGAIVIPATHYTHMSSPETWKYGCDLTNAAETDELFNNHRPNYVIHAAGYNGGIEFNMKYPADIFVRNTSMAMNIMNACHEYKVEKILSIVASCAYPDIDMGVKDDTVEEEDGGLPEEFFLSGEPNPSVACHGYAKRFLHLLGKFYNDQYNLNAVTACVTTLYGPGDSFDLGKTKVLGALVKRIVDAHDERVPELTLWGSGKARRQFIYADDAAKLVCDIFSLYDDSSMPINIATDPDMSIKKLARIICECVGYEGKILWDTSKPDGQMRKQLSNETMYSLLEFYEDYPSTNIATGILNTIGYYRELKCKNSE